MSGEMIASQREGGTALRLSAVLFDLDDTLADSLSARLQSLRAVFTSAGLWGPTPEGFLRDLRGRQITHALAKLEAEAGKELDLVERYLDTYWSASRGTIRLYPGVEGMLKELRIRGLKLGVVTQKPRAAEMDGRSVGAAAELRELGIAHLFSVVVGYEDVTFHKPHPQSLLLAMEQLGVHPHDALMVGDSAADIQAAEAAGCWSCQAAWGISDEMRNMPDARPGMVAETPESLLGILLPG